MGQLDAEIAALERGALQGDAACVRRLATLARASAPAEDAAARLAFPLGTEPVAADARTIRNWYLRGGVSAAGAAPERRIGVGCPPAATGAFWLDVLARDAGGCVRLLALEGNAALDGRLTLRVNHQVAWRGAR